jgi:adenylyltransferase/sulfurtransferase
VHRTASLGQKKTDSARAALQALNPWVAIECVEQPLTADNLDALLTGVDVVVDGCDNFATRDAVNAACVRVKRPLVSAAAIGFAAQLSVFDSRQPESPCYRCLYADEDEVAASCSENGVLATVPGVVGLLAATEVIKLITGLGKPLVGKLWLWEATSATMRTLSTARDPACPVCG